MNPNKSRPWVKLLSHIFCEHRDKLFGNRFAPTNKPWMRYREIAVLEELLVRLKPRSCLEWALDTAHFFFRQS